MMSEVQSNGKYCMGCGTHFRWGEFAYNQELCWDCFEKRVERIAKNIHSPEDAEIVRHLLIIAKEIFRRNI